MRFTRLVIAVLVGLSTLAGAVVASGLSQSL